MIFYKHFTNILQTKFWGKILKIEEAWKLSWDFRKFLNPFGWRGENFAHSRVIWLVLSSPPTRFYCFILFCHLVWYCSEVTNCQNSCKKQLGKSIQVWLSKSIFRQEFEIFWKLHYISSFKQISLRELLRIDIFRELQFSKLFFLQSAKAQFLSASHHFCSQNLRKKLTDFDP